MRGTTRDMSDKHEALLLAVLGGKGTPGSGNQWNQPMDGRHSRHDQSVAFAWDGKSTLANSISVTRKMWEKAQDQALGERPMLALRFYDNERLTRYTDLAVISLDDLVELLQMAQRLAELEAQ